MTWEPTTSRARGPVSYNGPPMWSGGDACSGSYTAGARRLGETLRQRFPFIKTVGGYSCRRNSADEGQTSIHGVGRALDLMIDRVDGSADRRGDEVARWLIEHAHEIGVQLIIWDGTIWSTLRDSLGTHRPYTGPIRHTDHLHVEVNQDAADERLPWYRGDATLDNESSQNGADMGNIAVVTAAIGASILFAYLRLSRR